MARGDVGQMRREQIIEAAVAIIAEQGLQHLSLSAIEDRAHLSRGQLTYYFPAKEDILLAVFDRLIEMMHRRARAGEGPPGCQLPPSGWERVRAFLNFMILQPPEAPEFHALQYTFLSQIPHRDDFRQRLASLYEDWRRHMAGDLEQPLVALPASRRVSPRTLASFIQALLHGLAMQREADPDAYDRQEMARLCLEVLELFLGKTEPSSASNGEVNSRRSKADSPEVNHA